MARYSLHAVRKDEMAMNFRIKCYDENAFRKVDMAKRGASIHD